MFRTIDYWSNFIFNVKFSPVQEEKIFLEFACSGKRHDYFRVTDRKEVEFNYATVSEVLAPWDWRIAKSE